VKRNKSMDFFILLETATGECLIKPVYKPVELSIKIPYE
jgi:hypothetical protein